MPQVAIASTDTRINGQHSRVTYFEEPDASFDYDVDGLTHEEFAELSMQFAAMLLIVDDDTLVAIIDALEDGEEDRAYM